MCKLGGSGIGGILGSLGGVALDSFAPELGIPLSIATGLGGALGGTLGGVASGENFGKAALGGLESGALSGGLAGLGELASTGDFLGSLGSSATGDAGSVAGAAAGSPSRAGGVSNAVGPSLGFTPTGNSAVDSVLSTAASNQGTADLNALVAADPTGTGASSLLSTLDNAGSGAVNFLKNNPGLALGGGGILASLLMNNSIPGLAAVQSQEQLLQGLGAQNLSAGQTGQIPGGQQAQLDAAERAAEASTRSTFGREGIGGSTMENQSLVADKIAEATAKNQIIDQIMSQGAAELGSAGTLATGIMNTELAQNKDVQDAIGRFAAALAGSSGLKAAAA